MIYNILQFINNCIILFLNIVNGVQVRPVYKRQQESFDRILKCITHLIYLLVETARTADQQTQVENCVRALVWSCPRSSTTGDTLLHLCVSRLNTIKSSYFSDDNQARGVVFTMWRVILLHYQL